MKSDWTEPRMDLLRECFAEGGSSSVIARKINAQTGSLFTRNAVIGKLGRLGLNIPRGTSDAKPKKRRRQKLTDLMFSFKGGNGGLTRAQRMQVKRTGRYEKFDIPAPTVITEEHKCSHHELVNNSCRYPLWGDDVAYGDKFFCGIPEADMKEGLPWCRHHCLVVYRPPSESRLRAAE